MPNRVEQPFALIDTNGQLDAVNDSVAGGTQDLTNAAHYAGVLGGRIWLAQPIPYKTTQLYGGAYMYVKFYLSATASAAVGLPVYWAYTVLSTAFETYLVNTDATAVNTGRIAGFALNAVSKGNFGWIQTKGKANIKYKTGLTAATPADGDLLIVDSGTGLVDDPTQSGNPTFAQLKAVIGTAIGAPVSNTVGLALLRNIPDVV